MTTLPDSARSKTPPLTKPPYPAHERRAIGGWSVLLLLSAVLAAGWFAIGTSGAGAQAGDEPRAAVNWGCAGPDGRTGYLTVTVVNNSTNGPSVRIEINDDDTHEQILEAPIIKKRLGPNETFSHTFSDIHNHAELKPRVYHNGTELYTVHELNIFCDPSTAGARTGCSANGFGWIDVGYTSANPEPLVITLDGKAVTDPIPGNPESPPSTKTLSNLATGTYRVEAIAGDDTILSRDVIVDCDFGATYSVSCQNEAPVLELGVTTLLAQHTDVSITQVADGERLDSIFDMRDDVYTQPDELGVVTFSGFEPEANQAQISIRKGGYTHEWSVAVDLGCRVDELSQIHWEVHGCGDDRPALLEVDIGIDDVPGWVTATAIGPVGTELVMRSGYAGSDEVVSLNLDGLTEGTTIDLLVTRENGESAIIKEIPIACDDGPTPIQNRDISIVDVSCLAGNGRIDVTIENNGADRAQYAVNVGRLAPRMVEIEDGEDARVTVTGRRDGPIDVVIAKEGVIVDWQTMTVACDASRAS